MPVTPDAAREWVLVGRDLAIVLVSVALLLWQGIFVRYPNEYVLGAAASLLIAPVFLRADEARRKSPGSRKQG